MTDYHAKYLAHLLLKRGGTDKMERLAGTMRDAKIELTPHQVEAALFAFRSPLSKGVILADVVGLGKTIEAGLVIARKWAERKRRILIIVPANLRKQWNQELWEKFYLPSMISSRNPEGLRITCCEYCRRQLKTNTVQIMEAAKVQFCTV